jgi:hypothetical protein
MDNFDLRKYLAENKLIKEDISSHKEEAKRFLEKFIDDNEDTFEFIPDLETGYIDAKDNSYNVDELASIFLDIGQDIPRGKYNQKYKGEGGTYVVVAERKLLKEFVGKELEDRNEPLYDKLVPGNGDAETVEGEMLRAINRLIYRYYNDGDKYYEGYGTETAGPAHSFLVNANHPQKAIMNRLFKEFISDDEYERMLKDILDVILDHIESRQGEYTKNTLGGMFKYEPEFEDMEEEEDPYDDYDEEEDYYQE